jgi:LuxR family maltose regulon positive regulatory protein
MKVKLAEIGSRQITTIIAPMGYGKTTAVKWWSSRRTKSNESSQFFKLTVISYSVADLWSGICRIFRGHPDVHKQLKALGFPTNNQSLYLFADIMISVLAEYDDKEFIYFIIDDIHLLPSYLITPFIL